LNTLKDLATDPMEKRFIGAFILTLILCIIMPIKEMRWVLWGKPAAATLVSVAPERRGEEVTAHFKRVAYEFDDGGVIRSESDLVTTNWPTPGFDKTGMAPPGVTIDIEYLPDTTSSRLKGHDDRGWFWGSGIMAIIVVIGGVCWWKFRDAR
jgi:hypothetical protein